MDIDYIKAIELLKKCSSTEGFLASSQNISNYKRVWARDGVICGLAALASGDEDLIDTFRKTLETLAKNQHSNGTIPSNVMTNGDKVEVSYGGLAGRVDSLTWFIIGICQYAHFKNDMSFVAKYNVEIQKCFFLLEAWEFNNNHLVYVPLSGNWADEYITDGYVLYDQLLRVWALKSYNYFAAEREITHKIQNITSQIEINFTPNSTGEKYHERAYNELLFQNFMPCSFSPSGYKKEFDAFANSLALLLGFGSKIFKKSMIDYPLSLKEKMPMKLLPAFWPPIYEKDEDWKLLRNNCKYEFRNFPYEFHNGGSWSMVNGFFGLALLSVGKKEEATELLKAINEANAVENYSFFENFNSETQEPNGVPYCAWSAAATVMLHQSINTNFKFIL